ncbi:hypothetical protein AB835_12145 [Candidatus Endobugula sertula]|uniref:Uncharacterized protein n=1 Tax=Candidatus Endobugula sertula TaxID=62101 RepID=A0A1D2QML6_9GAMM|nr:hypothetical protein AB835_12145 [Candidatus Endobugula sertula]
MGGIRVNQSGRIEISPRGNKEKELSRDMQLLLLLNHIQQMELQLEKKYGENFAETLAAEYLDEETYQRLMEIQDQDERRTKIALALKEGIENGTIDLNKLDDPKIREWIDARSEQENHISIQAQIQSKTGFENSSQENAFIENTEKSDANFFKAIL